jgi:hypothetical protein
LALAFLAPAFLAPLFLAPVFFAPVFLALAFLALAVLVADFFPVVFLAPAVVGCARPAAWVAPLWRVGACAVPSPAWLRSSMS